MARTSKLLAALDAHKGNKYTIEKQKALVKSAGKRRREKIIAQSSRDKNDVRGTVASREVPQLENESDGWESDSSADAMNTFITHDPDVSVKRKLIKDGIGGGHEEEEDSEGIPVSELDSVSSSQKEDLVPYQRLTINNTSALLRAYKSIALLATLPFSAHQTITSAEQISISDVHDDLDRELAFYKQSLDAATEARSTLKKEGVPFARPVDYFAEMVKSDEHMGKIKSKMTEEAAGKKASAEARKQRDLKKFGKQVQVAKLQERDRTKKNTIDKINLLKRKRKDGDVGNAKEEDLFDVALEDAGKTENQDRANDRKGGQTRDKRQKKDERFGYGGKKRFIKSGDAMSSGDLKGFSTKRMKGIKKVAGRLGKSRRTKP